MLPATNHASLTAKCEVCVGGPMHIYFPSSDGFVSITKIGLVMHFPISHDFCVLYVCRCCRTGRVFVPFGFWLVCHTTSDLSFFCFNLFLSGTLRAGRSVRKSRWTRAPSAEEQSCCITSEYPEPPLPVGRVSTPRFLLE